MSMRGERSQVTNAAALYPCSFEVDASTLFDGTCALLVTMGLFIDSRRRANSSKSNEFLLPVGYYHSVFRNLHDVTR